MDGISTEAAHDYQHAIEETRRRLHDQRGSKAAVIVGAGFSLNAVPRTPGRKKFPLWQELTNELAGRLYPNKKDRDRVLASAGATSSAMRLAQEFEVAFGRSALIEFIRDAVRDDEYLPSQLHRDLLELRWADVFTTNYDRLLEVAARSLWKRNYETVYSISDLPLARRPRIVKLHGSLPDLNNLVLTEDDYRTYPRKYAPFVTAVQAALTENVLCLIGFSGDDPNFLAWSGWLRDELRAAVPKTYLFTGNELKPFQRQLLEERHIIPVPLKRIAELATGKKVDYEGAYHWLFGELAKPLGDLPPIWNVGPRYAISRIDSSIAKEPSFPDRFEWIDATILWRQHRQQYKGWYALHREGADRLWQNTEFWIGHLNAKVLESWDAPTSLFVLSELVWRWSTALQPLHDNVVFKILDPHIKQFVEWRSMTKEQSVVVSGSTRNTVVSLPELDDAYELLLRECLRHAREIGDDVRFQDFAKQLEDAHPAPEVGPLNDAQSFLRHQQVLRLLGRLQHGPARQMLQSWDASNADIIWTIRRAGLCLECGLLTLGSQLLESALDSLRSVPVSPLLDIRRMSAEGITLYLLWSAYSANEFNSASAMDSNDSSKQSAKPLRKFMVDRLNELGDYGCDPNEFLEWLEEMTAPEPRATKGVFQYEDFDIGHVGRNATSGAETQLTAAYRAIRFIEDAAIPLAIPNVITTTVCAKIFRSAVATIAFFAPHEATGLVFRSRDEKTVQATLSRKCLAALSENQVESLLGTVVRGLDDAIAHLAPPPAKREREDQFWDQQLNVAAAALGHVVVKLKDPQVAEVVRHVIGLPHDLRVLGRWRNHDVLAACIRRAVCALDKKGVEDLLPVLLQTPVRGSKELPSELESLGKWYDPVTIAVDFDWRRDAGARIKCENLIDSLLARVATAAGDERVNLCLRAAHLLDAGLLSARQQATFTASLFVNSDDYDLPKETGCLDALVLSLPRSSDFDEVGAFRAKHFNSVEDRSLWDDLRRTCTPIREFRRSPARSLKWTKGDLTTLLNLAAAWLANATVLSEAARQSRHPFEIMFDRVDEQQAVFLHWLGTMENLALLNRRASEQHRRRANDLIAQAETNGWCATQSVAARASFGFVAVANAVEDIRYRLGDRAGINVRQACDAIGRWHELAAVRGFEAPAELQQMLATLVAERRHEYLSLLIYTCGTVMRRLSRDDQLSFWSQLSNAIGKLQVETDYGAGDDVSPFTIETKLRIRVACARLVRRMLEFGHADAVVDRWIAYIRADQFADVRRELGR